MAVFLMGNIEISCQKKLNVDLFKIHKYYSDKSFFAQGFCPFIGLNVIICINVYFSIFIYFRAIGFY